MLDAFLFKLVSINEFWFQILFFDYTVAELVNLGGFLSKTILIALSQTRLICIIETPRNNPT